MSEDAVDLILAETLSQQDAAFPNSTITPHRFVPGRFEGVFVNGSLKHSTPTDDFYDESIMDPLAERQFNHSKEGCNRTITVQQDYSQNNFQISTRPNFRNNRLSLNYSHGLSNTFVPNAALHDHPSNEEKIRNKVDGYHQESLQSQFRGPWTNLTNTGGNRVVLEDISNCSTIYTRRRIDSIRASIDSFTSRQWDENLLFQRILTSTPFALNLSLDQNPTPLNWVIDKSSIADSKGPSRFPAVLDLRKKNIETSEDQPLVSSQPTKIIHGRFEPYATISFRLINDKVTALADPPTGSSFIAVDLDRNWSNVTYEVDYTNDANDPDWIPDGDATKLDNLTIYEYFEEFKNNVSDADTDAENEETEQDYGEDNGEFEHDNEGEDKVIEPEVDGEPQPKKVNLKCGRRIKAEK
ncbi:uncharacterized protein LOC129769426 isoform X2 [Toxorhynchites rutilus septentrionalis]|uniref:uncharacterized protein LOC129769426 isoform X2 n=1 Tax=Toxorhynchites rutilus septentrionalis TaxID=329112 RepID=UPI002478B9CF|nr:uncharacterized protein LOC129769426 isoform X2 [Toxorhynchites rutilus septentrionalis]